MVEKVYSEQQEPDFFTVSSKDTNVVKKQNPK